MRKVWLFILSVIPFFASAQMVVGTDTLFGNEWIDYDQHYFKIQLAEDGIYRISGAELASAGVPIDQIQSDHYQLFHFGQQIPIYVSTSGSMGSSDYLEFYGSKNQTVLDKHLFPDSPLLLNPDYSLFTDTSAYFLTWNEMDSGLRYSSLANDTIGHPDPTPYFIQTERRHFADYWAKKEYSSSAKYSHFDDTEGFSTVLQNNQTHTFTPVSPYTAGQPGYISIRYTCRGEDHHQEIFVNGALKMTDEYNGYDVREWAFEVPATDLNQSVSIQLNGLMNNSNVIDRQRVAASGLIYPQLFDFEGLGAYLFPLPENTQHFLDISNFDHGGINPILYDVANHQRLEGLLHQNQVHIQLPTATKERQLALINPQSGFRSISTIESIVFRDFSTENSDYVIISHPSLMGGSENQVQHYADYRSSMEGGNYTPLIVDIHQLYDQFGYGISRHPIGMRNFIHGVLTKMDKSRFIYIIGKGRLYNDMRTAQQVANATGTFFVPTFGSPGGDNLFVTNNFDPTPVLAIGRLAATNPEEIRIYLDKIKAQELSQNSVNTQTIEAQAWKKKVIHLGGGGNASEQLLFKSYLNGLKTDIENNKFGSDVYSFFRTGTDPIQVALSDDLFERINSGVTMITFFGHAGTNSFDFRIDNPDNYDNVGKYPFLMSLGCYSGNLFTSEKSISERFCFYEDKGAVLFGATGALGFSSSLNLFADEFYSELGGNSYGKGIGEIQQASLDNFKSNSSLGLKLLYEQFNVHGDPALRLNPMEGQDFVVDETTVQIIPERIDAQSDSFDVQFAIANIGYHQDDSIGIELRHQMPSGEENYYTLRIATPAFSEIVHARIPTNGKKSVGANRLFIRVDYSNEVEEKPMPEAELNNNLIYGQEEGIGFFVSDNSAIPISPREFAIVNDTDVRLLASTTDALADEAKYVIEIDTSGLFDSQFKIVKEITASGSLIEWQPEIAWSDGQVYFWRISADSISPDESYAWRDASFIYLSQGSEGWNQSHFYQFSKDEFANIKPDTSTRLLEFADNFVHIRIRNKGRDGSDKPEYYHNTKRYGSPFKWTIPVGINVVVIDSLTGQYWFNPPGGINNTTSGNILSFPFKTETKEERAQLIHFLRDSIPTKHYVILYSAQNAIGADYHPEEWAADSISVGDINLYNLLEAQGAEHIRSLSQKGSVPYVIMYRKDVGILNEGIGDSIQSIINVEVTVPGYWFEGSISSHVIGPAQSWESLELDVLAQGADDVFSVSLFGINLQSDTILLDSQVVSDRNLSDISADEYPYLVLKMNAEDLVYRTAPQLQSWRVYFEGVPEAIINPQLGFLFLSDTIQQGQPLTVSVGIQNISKHDMDSLLIGYQIVDDYNNRIETSTYVAPLLMESESTASIELVAETKELSGNQRFIMELNPNNEQPEQYHFNNYLRKSFFVLKDNRKPSLDVRFDGVRILDGDIVSASPSITMVLDDENESEYFRLTDTSIIQVSLIHPDGQFEKLYYFNNQLKLVPAEDESNIAKVLFEPNLLINGTYQLQVQANDMSGNSSGDLPYQVSFEVINEVMISSVVAYPNPFSNGTRFAYTLTGSSPPDEFIIRILTMTGRLVREITNDDLGEIKIGKHLTEFVWDGTDQNGSHLANGVYLYKVIVKNNGEPLSNYDNSSANNDNNGIGKIVIMR